MGIYFSNVNGKLFCFRTKNSFKNILYLSPNFRVFFISRFIDDDDDDPNMESSFAQVQKEEIRRFKKFIYIFFYKHIFGLHTAHQVPRDAFHSHR